MAPQPLTPLERDAGFACGEIQHVARAGNAERARENAHIARDEEISPAFGKCAVVRVFMQDRAVRRAVILRPLVLDVNERPLAAAELKMLQAGELEESSSLKSINHFRFQSRQSFYSDGIVIHGGRNMV